MSNFDRAFQIVLGIEAGYVNDKKDPGGETKYGISKRAYPSEDIANLTLERAKFLYKRDYWDKHGCDSMEWGKALCVFDSSVNGGPVHRWWLAHWAEPIEEFLINWQADHILYLSELPEWRHDGLGWARRLFKIYGAASGAGEGK